MIERGLREGVDHCCSFLFCKDMIGYTDISIYARAVQLLILFTGHQIDRPLHIMKRKPRQITFSFSKLPVYYHLFHNSAYIVKSQL